MSTENAEKTTGLLFADDWLKVKEVALTLRVSPMTVYRLVYAGLLEGVRVGRSVRISETAVRDFIEHGRREVALAAVERGSAIVDLLRDLVDPDDCWFDPRGDCQAHGSPQTEAGRCPHARAKELLAEVDGQAA